LRPGRAQRAKVEVRALIAALRTSGQDQVVVGQLEPAGPPRGEGLERFGLEPGRAFGPGYVPHGPPAGGHRRERVGRDQRIGRGGPPGLLQRRGGRGEPVIVVINRVVGLDQGHVHRPADGGQDLGRGRAGQDHHGAGVAAHAQGRKA